MNKFITSLTLALIAACPLTSFSEPNIETDPAYLPIDKFLDLKAIPPQVNINLPRFLLKDAVSNLGNSPGDPLAGSGIDIADLVKDVKLIRVVVIEANKTNRPALDKAMKKLRADLDAKWTPIVSVPEDNVGIYAMGDPSGESMAGVAVLVYEDDAVICNVVGRVSIAKLIKIASQSNKLPKDLLRKLQGGVNQPALSPAPKTDGNAATNKPVEALETTRKEP